MRCKNCDYSVDESARFCPECGTSVISDSSDTTNTDGLTENFSKTRKSRIPVVITLVLVLVLGTATVFALNFVKPSLEERVNQLNEAEPVSDDELDFELFKECVAEINFFAEVIDEMTVSIEDLGGGYEAIAVAATRGSLAAANKALSEFPDYAPGFARMSGQFYSAPHCGSATLDSYNVQIASVAGKIDSDLRSMASKVSELGPEYDRVLESLDDMSFLLTDLEYWLILMELDI